MKRTPTPAERMAHEKAHPVSELYNNVSKAMAEAGYDPDDEYNWHLLDQIATEHLFQRSVQRQFEAMKTILKGDKKS